MGAWDISTSVFLQSFDISFQDITPRGLFFKPDGFKMYVLGLDDQDVNEYNLSSAWDISTASFLQLFDLSGQDEVPLGLFFRADGLKMYFAGSQNDSIYEYSLSSAWNISTASFVRSLNVSSKDSTPISLFFKPDGLKMFFLGASSRWINEYDLSSAWNISTAIFLQRFSVKPQDITPTGLFFKPDGLKVYVSGLVNNNVNEYNLSSAWDISTSVFLQSFSIIPQDTRIIDTFFKPDGLKMYISGDTGNNIYEYDLVDIDFSGTPRKKKDSLTVQFTDLSIPGPTSWSWKRRPSGIDASYVEFSTDENPSEEFDIESP